MEDNSSHRGLSAASLSILIVTYNSAQTIRATLDALPLGPQIIVVDNSSTDDTARIIESQYATRVMFVRSGGNVGFARAVNLAASKATGDRFLLLNPDAVIPEESICTTLAAMDSLPQVGVCAPLVVEGSGELKTLAAGYEPSIWRMSLHATGVSRLGSKFPMFRGHYLMRGQLSSDSPEYVKWVSGGCMFIQRATWNQVNGLSERWFMYAEDVDFCLRAGDAGWSVAVVPQSTAHHSVGASSNDAHGPVRTLWLENLYDLYTLRYSPSRTRSALWRGVVAGGYLGRAVLLRVAAAAKGSRTPDARRFFAYARAAWRAGSRGH